MKQKKKKSLREYIAFNRENLYLKSMWTRILVLLTAVVFVILVFCFIYLAVRGEEWTFPFSLWKSTLHILDSNALAVDSGSWTFLIFAFLETIFGILVTGTLISLITTGLQAYLQHAGGGREKVVLKVPHVLVLGYHELTESVIQGLIDDNDLPPNVPLVVMDEITDITEMVREVKQLHKNQPKKVHKVYCRKGNICKYDDLDRCAIENARSIIIFGQDDFETMKSIIACNAKLKMAESDNSNQPYLIAIIREQKNARKARTAGGSNVKVLSQAEGVSRILASAGRHSGISYVYQDIISSYEDRIQLNSVFDIRFPSDVEKLRLNSHLKNGYITGGILKAEKQPAGFDKEPFHTYLFPSDTGATAGDYQQFFIMSDPTRPLSALDGSSVPVPDASVLKEHPLHLSGHTPRILIIGNGGLLKKVLNEENRYYTNRGSVDVLVAGDVNLIANELGEDITESYPALHIEVQECKTESYLALQELLEETGIKHVILLADHTLSQREADEKVLSQLIYLQDIRSRVGSRNNDFSIACEISLIETLQLVQETGRNDYVAGNSIVASAAARIASAPEMYDLLSELLISTGCGINTYPITDYLNFTDDSMLETDLYTLAEACARAGEIFIGFHRLSYDKNIGELSFGRPEINPPAWNADGLTLQKYRFWAEDELIVIGRDLAFEEKRTLL